MVYVDSTFNTQSQTTPEQVALWVKSLGYQDGTAEAEMIREAFLLADMAHGGQKRASGEPYITHAMAVAEILVDLRLDPEAIIAAILHDVVEDSEVTVDSIRERFGDSVAKLVDGVTKLDRKSVV